MASEMQRSLRVARDMSLRDETEPTRALDLHRRTLEAIERGDEQEIDAIMSEHLTYLEVVFTQAGGRLRTRRLPSFLG